MTTMFSDQAGLVDRQGIYDDLDAAELALLEAEARPVSAERWVHVAAALERRADALRLLAMSRPLDSRNRHIIRAIELAERADLDRARMIRRRLAGGAR